MALYSPIYCESFKCLAGACTHSCCVGWEIDVDEKTRSKYLSSDMPYAKSIRDSLIYNDSDSVYCFATGEDKRCVHLSREGLCNIIIGCSEGYLCDICREHPRFYNHSQNDTYMGIGAACPEGARLILYTQDFASLLKREDRDRLHSGEGTTTTFNMSEALECAYKLIIPEDKSYIEKERALIDFYNVNINAEDNEYWRSVIDCFEFLNPKNRELYLCYSTDAEASGLDAYTTRALAYFIYRYCTGAENSGEFREGLWTALFLARLLVSVLDTRPPQEPNDIISALYTLSEEIEYSERNIADIKQEFDFYDLIG